jgi:hypothetical protein
MSVTLLEAAMSPATLLVFKVSLLLGAAACAAGLLRRRTSAATRHLIWSSALVGTLLLPVASIVLPGWTFAIRTAQHADDPPTVLDRETNVAASPGTLASVAVDADAPPAGVRPFDLSWPALIGVMYSAGSAMAALLDLSSKPLSDAEYRRLAALLKRGREQGEKS